MENVYVGGARDAELIEDLKSGYPSMRDFGIDGGRGFGEGKLGNHNTTELGVPYEMLDKNFDKEVPFNRLVVPINERNIRRLGKPSLYKGNRIIVRRGVVRSGHRNGEIQAKLFSQNFAFTDNFIGISVEILNEDQRIILLGILQSSLAKYYHFLTSAMWGIWHFKIHTDEHLNFPIAFPTDNELSERIISSTKNLSLGIISGPMFTDTEWKHNQSLLDDAIFDLYELSERQRDLVRDLCESILEFFYNGSKSEALKPPSPEDLEMYRLAFLESWDTRLFQHGKYLETTIYAPTNGIMYGVIFQLKDGFQSTLQSSTYLSTSDSEIKSLFQRIGSSLREKISHSIYTDKVLKILLGNAICIIKRAEKRHWTKSQARQDASEFLTEVFSLEWQTSRG